MKRAAHTNKQSPTENKIKKKTITKENISKNEKIKKDYKINKIGDFKH